MLQVMLRAPPPPEGPRPRHRELRGVLDRALVATLRDAVVAAAGDLGLAGGLAADGSVRATPGAALAGTGWDDPRWIALQQRVLATPALASLRDALAWSEALMRLLGARPEGGHGDVVRLTCPGQASLATRPHQDGFYVGPAADLWTVWVPLVPCPLVLGPLAVLRDPTAGLRPHRPGPHGVPELTGLPTPDEAPEVWEPFPLEPGDALAVRHDAVHAALPNLTPDRLRVSVDLRFRGHVDCTEEPAA